VGYLGSIHARILAKIPTANFVGVYDINEQRAEQISNEIGVRSFSTLDGLLDNVEAVVIATPTTTHKEIALHCLTRGVHTFIEKPITDNVAGADEIIKVAKEKNLKVQVGHVERFNPALLSISNYKINPVFIETHRLAQFKPRGTDVAVVLDLMIHDIDIILNLVKSEIEEIRASGVEVISDSIDIANARIQFKNGCIANITASRISRKNERKMRIFQKDAYISIDFLQGMTEIFRLVDEDKDGESSTSTVLLGKIEEGTKKRKIIYEQPKVRDINPIEAELIAFIDSIIYDKPTVVSPEDGKLSLEVAFKIVEEIERQQKIVKEKMSLDI
ncbi:MAG: Gfo/Idh/MocA family protein, partial [Candidatus Kryptonium sp.]